MKNTPLISHNDNNLTNSSLLDARPFSGVKQTGSGDAHWRAFWNEALRYLLYDSLSCGISTYNKFQRVRNSSCSCSIGTLKLIFMCIYICDWLCEKYSVRNQIIKIPFLQTEVNDLVNDHHLPRENQLYKTSSEGWAKVGCQHLGSKATWVSYQDGVKNTDAAVV